MLRRLSLLAIPCLILAIVLPTALGAAPPKKGASYVGDLPETTSRISKRVVLKVSKAYTGKVRLECGGTRYGVSSKFDIVKGKFTAKKQTGSLLVWRLQGKFVSSSTARAKLYLPAACDGKGGKITLNLKK
jgi:hypothetical protein